MEHIGETTVMVAGKFDPVHDGHIDHILKASSLAHKVIIVTHRDETLKKIKGKCNIPLWARLAILKGLVEFYNLNAEVILADDDDGKVAETILNLQPDYFAKGGDRTPENMPKEEIDACEEVGCEIIYGVGELLNSSSKMTKEEEMKTRSTHLSPYRLSG